MERGHTPVTNTVQYFTGKLNIKDKRIAKLQAENKLLKEELSKNAAFVYNQAILATPTGELRNKLTGLNILRLQALQEKP